MRDLEVSEVRVAMSGEPPVVVLREVDGERLLPIWMTAGGAAAIVSATMTVDPHRPAVHDLLAKMIGELGGQLRETRIMRYLEGQFFAELDLGDRVVGVRPSDGIALAMRLSRPIRCTDEVLAEAGVDSRPGDEFDRFREFLDQVNPGDFDP